MANEIIIGAAGLIGVFLAWYAFSRSAPQQPKRQKSRPSSSSSSSSSPEDLYSDVLNNDKYKVKGQWER